MKGLEVEGEGQLEIREMKGEGQLEIEDGG